MASSIDSFTSTSRPTFSGLATGLDTSALVENLLALEREPLNRLEERRGDVADQQDLMRELNTKLLALRDATREIDNRSLLGGAPSSTEEFLSYKTESSDDDVVDARASNGATPGTIDVTVQQVATTGRQFSDTFSTTDTAEIAAGTTIRIDLNDGDATEDPPREPTTIFDYTVGADGITLAGLKGLINTGAGNEDLITAEIVQIADDEFRMVISAKEAGEESDFTISGDAITLDPTLGQAAVNAQFTVSGLDLERSTNTISDVLEGITFELKAVSVVENQDDVTNNGADPIYRDTAIEVDVDDDEIATTIESFITKFNDVMNFINKQQRVDENTKRSGLLGNDSTVRTIKAQLLDQISRSFDFTSTPNSPFTSPGSIGLQLESGGKLKLDKDKLSEALERNTLAVRRMFSGAVEVDENGETVQVPRLDGDGKEIAGTLVDSLEHGIATGITSLLKPIVRTGDGLLATRDAGFDQRLDGFDDSIERFSRRLSKRQETLVAQFTRLEQIVASFNAQSTFLAGL